MSWVERERNHIKSNFCPEFDWVVNEDAPWAPLSKPLARSKVALITSAGVHLKADPPFDVGNNYGDVTFRRVPASATADQIMISHGGYDHAEAERDLNVVFPADRFRELEAEGIIGEFAPMTYHWMGYIPVTAKLVRETAPAVACELLAEGVDAALLVPA